MRAPRSAALARWVPPAAVALSMLGGRGAASPDFARDVRPILESHCVGCHGPSKQKSRYRLDVRETALKGGESGKPAIVPHNARESPLIRYISGEDPDIVMPPKKSDSRPLTPAEVATLRAWVDAGPTWPDEFAGSSDSGKPHWSLQPLVRRDPPSAEGHPIDAFLREKLAAKNLAMSPPADARTLCRRLYFDLTGLPPAPEEVEAFVTECGTDPASTATAKAGERLADRLLASPRYGERWARHWFDTIHFADTHGFEHDVARDHAWPFRDYVIAALNQDTRWPRFIREQLAADYFFPEEPGLTPALGFLGAGTFDLSAFSTAPVTFEYLDRDDLVTQTMAAFVSTTANCARCHAHKFDPITQEDYYALQAVFAGLVKGDLPYDDDAAIGRARTGWNRLLAATDPPDAAVLLAAENEALVREWVDRRGSGIAWQALEPETFLSSDGATLTRGEHGIISAGGPRPDKDTYTITASPSLASLTAVRLDVLASDALPMRGPGRQHNGNLHLSEFSVRVFEPGQAEPRPVAFRRATADFNQTGWGIERAIDGDGKTAWGIHPAVGQSHHAVFELDEKRALKPGSRVAIVLQQSHGAGHLIGSFRLSATDGPADQVAARPAAVEAALAVPATDRSTAQRLTLAAAALKERASAELAKLPVQARVFAAGRAVELNAGEARNAPRTLPGPREVHVLSRGDFDKPLALAAPGALSAITAPPARFALKDPQNEAERRAALADWIAHPENPLTWRSVVNRVWHYHFGRGLCDTPSDFGKMGGEPSHVELLDWLAAWFRDDARGSLKQLHRLIVTSAAYRQSSTDREQAALVDSDNRLLWRQNRHRLDADAFRDFTLAVSGRLDLAMGGPGVRNFKSSPGPQVTPALDYTAFDWNGPGAGRRSIYRFVWRGIADPLMEALDFPDLGLLAPTRNFSVSSLQALALYNNDFVLHHANALAERAAAEAPTPEEQVRRAVRRVWLRDPSADESRDFTDFAHRHGLPALCRLLLNSNEFLFIE